MIEIDNKFLCNFDVNNLKSNNSCDYIINLNKNAVMLSYLKNFLCNLKGIYFFIKSGRKKYKCSITKDSSNSIFFEKWSNLNYKYGDGCACVNFKNETILDKKLFEKIDEIDKLVFKIRRSNLLDIVDLK